MNVSKKIRLIFGGLKIVGFLIFLNPVVLFAQNPNDLPRNIQSTPGPLANNIPGASMPGADPFHLLMNSREVQQDMNLTDTQIRHLSSIGRRFRSTMRESSYHSNDEVTQQIESGQQMIGRVLTPKQIDRLRQIMLQIEGPCNIMSDTRDLDRLGIQPDSSQAQQIQSICRDMGNQIRSLVENLNQSHPTDPCMVMMTVGKKMQGIKYDVHKQVNQILTASQNNTLNEMKGRPLALRPMIPPMCAPAKIQNP